MLRGGGGVLILGISVFNKDAVIPTVKQDGVFSFEYPKPLTLKPLTLNH